MALLIPASRRRRWWLALVVTALLAARAALATEPGAKLPEYAVKAAFLYNFARFVSWPAEAFATEEAPLVLCVLGPDPFGRHLDGIRGRTVQGHRLVVHRTQQVEDTADAHILFVAESFEHTPQLLDRLAGKPVLSVGDAATFARRGGTLAFRLVDNRIRFEVNLATARRDGLGINARLLQLAETVLTGEGL